MYKCHGIAAWMALAAVANCAGAEYLLRVEEVDGPRPQIEQAADGRRTTTSSPSTWDRTLATWRPRTSEPPPAAEFGWLPVASVDSEPIRIGRHIELLVSTATEFHFRFHDGGELIELKGRIRKGSEIPAHVAVLPAALRRPPLKDTKPHRPGFVVEYEYAIEVEEEDGFPDIPSSSRRYIRGTLPISFERKFCLGGASETIDFPVTLWSLAKTETESNEEKD